MHLYPVKALFSAAALLFLFLLPVDIQAQFYLADLPDWENPQMIAQNKEPARAIFVPYGDIESALANDGLEFDSEYHKSLDGSWKFKWSENPAERPMDFFQQDFDVSSWDDIQVPGTWQMQGHGYPIYLNMIYPVQKFMGGTLHPPLAPKEYNPIGSYRKTFTIPDNWDERETFIHFGGVKSAFYLWVNGEKVGYSEGSMTPAEFNITPFLKSGENTVSVEVYRWSDGSWLEDQDMWRFSGIFRSVFLYSNPHVYIQDFFVKAGLDRDYRHGELEVEVEVRNNTNEPIGRPAVAVYVYDPEGNPLSDGPFMEGITENAMPAGTHNEVVLEGVVSDPQKWTSETPHLYTVIMELKDEEGNVLQVTRSTTGFRTVEIIDKMFMVNGEEVKLKGANAHEHDPYKGRTVDTKWIEKDLQLMKQSNFNAIRMAHYPHDRRYYDLADKYGLYVIDEANIEAHGISFRQNLVPGSDPNWLNAVVDRGRSMVEANKNHPSIVIWSLGNEAGHGENFDQMASFIRTLDPSRPIHYQHDNPLADMHSYMYPPVSSTQTILNDPDIDQPVILCEFVHSMGNSTGNLDEYMHLMKNHRNFMGVFIWDWVDQGLYKEDDQGKWFWAYGGDYGDDPNDANFNFNGLVSPDREPHPALAKVKYSYQFVEIGLSGRGENSIQIDNKYSDYNLSNFYLRWSLLEDGKSIQSGRMDDLDIPSGEWEVLTIPFDTPQMSPGREYHLNISLHLKEDHIWADKGFELITEQIELPYAVAPAEEIVAGSEPQTVNETGQMVTISGEGYSIRISKESGAVEGLEYNGESVLRAPLVPNFWRATTDNDRAGWRDILNDWRTAGENRQVTAFELSQDEQSGVTEVHVEGSIPVGETTYRTVYTVLSNGAMEVDYSLYPAGNDIPFVIPKVGMQMEIPEAYSQLTWFGKGPEETYVDRKIGIESGVYSGMIDSLWFNYGYPQENGNRTDVRWAAFTNSGGDGFMAVADEYLNISAWPYTLDDLQEATHINELPRRDFYTVNLDLGQQGVGGTNSWTNSARALPEYRLPVSQSYSYSFYFMPYTESMGDPGDVANKRFPE